MCGPKRKKQQTIFLLLSVSAISPQPSEYDLITYPWSIGQDSYRFEGMCLMQLDAGLTDWSVNVTFSKPVFNFSSSETSKIAEHTTWACHRNIHTYGTPTNLGIAFQVSYNGSEMPETTCLHLPQGTSHCVPLFATLGYNCSFDSPCMTPGSECAHGTCVCSELHVPIDGQCILAVPLDGACSYTTDCQDVNAFCDQWLLCTCKSFYLDVGGVCMKEVYLGGTCTGNSICVDDHTECNSTFQCACIQGFSEANFECEEDSLPTPLTISSTSIATTLPTNTPTVALTTTLPTTTTTHINTPTSATTITSVVNTKPKGGAVTTDTPFTTDTVATTTTTPVTMTTCACNCATRTGTPPEVALVAELKVDKKKTSATKRKLTSADDDRTSSKFLGVVGGIVLVSVFGVLCLIDLANVFHIGIKVSPH